MKKINSTITNLVLIAIFAAFGCVTTMAQRFAENPIIPIITEEKRPFDFADKFYSRNGVEPYLIFNRPTGTDKTSVFDKISDETRRDVRILAVQPAYNFDGSILYWNFYGEIARKSFTQDKAGLLAMKIADSFPIFVFPNALQNGTNRQSSLIEAKEGYFERNPLGLSVIVEVEYNSYQMTSEGEEMLKEMAERNGVSLDGTPIIKTVDEINLLTRMRLVTQKMKNADNPSQPSYAIAKVIKEPKDGAIAPDAFLMYLTRPNGKPFKAESFFVENFKCLQNADACVGNTDILSAKGF